MRYAPVVIPTLCRYSHFKNCIESLAECNNSDKTDVYIGLDYPLNSSQIDGYNQICSYLDNVHVPFKSFAITKRTKNYGVQKNIDALYEDNILGKYPAWIYTEDDNVFSNNFLDFINTNLNIYEQDENVYAVNGYSFPINYRCENSDIFKSHMYSPWGVGQWVNKQKRATSSEADNYLCHLGSAFQLLKKAPYLFEMLVSMRYANTCYGDTVIRARLLLNNMYCVTPVSTKVRNCGFDNSGINCSNDGGAHASQEIDCNDSYTEQPIVEISNLEKLYTDYFKISKVKLIKSVIKYFILLTRFISRRGRA